MPRARLISPDFWTAEAVVDCAPMTRLLLLGLSNFADDFGVLPLRPRTLRLQVFPGDALDDDAVRTMLDELVVRGLLRRYAVEGVEYLSIVDWEIHQRVGRHARRRYPAPSGIEADQGLTTSPKPPDHSNPERSPSASSAAPDRRGEKGEQESADAAWHAAVEGTLRRAWGADVPADVAIHAARWRAEGRDLAREVLPAIERLAAVAVEFNRPFHMAWVDGAMAGGSAQTIESDRN